MRAVALAAIGGHCNRLANGSRRRGSASGSARLMGHAIAALSEWRRRRRSRTALTSFDGRMLRDIGITCADAQHEINKPFWRG